MGPCYKINILPINLKHAITLYKQVVHGKPFNVLATTTFVIEIVLVLCNKIPFRRSSVKL